LIRETAFEKMLRSLVAGLPENWEHEWPAGGYRIKQYLIFPNQKCVIQSNPGE
jgi:hypothetical protein